MKKLTEKQRWELIDMISELRNREQELVARLGEARYDYLINEAGEYYGDTPDKFGANFTQDRVRVQDLYAELQDLYAELQEALQGPAKEPK